MKPMQGRIWGLVGGSLICLSLACQSSQNATAPGALPTSADLEAKPINATTYFAHGHLLERQGQFDRAVQQYHRALKSKSNFLSARNRLGITLNKLGKHSEATEQFLYAINLQPDAAYLYNNLGFSQYLEGDYETARESLGHALELRPDFARAHMNLAVTLARQNQFDQVLEHLNAAGTKSTAYYNLGLLLTESGRYAQAAEALQTALVTKPDFEAARQQLREVARLAAHQGYDQPAPTKLAASSEMLTTRPDDGPGEFADLQKSLNHSLGTNRNNTAANTPPATPIPTAETNTGAADTSTEPRETEAAAQTIETNTEPQATEQTTPTETSQVRAAKLPQTAVATATTPFAGVPVTKTTPTPPAANESATAETIEPSPPGDEPLLADSEAWKTDPHRLPYIMNDLLYAMYYQPKNLEPAWCRLQAYMASNGAPTRVAKN